MSDNSVLHKAVCVSPGWHKVNACILGGIIDFPVSELRRKVGTRRTNSWLAEFCGLVLRIPETQALNPPDTQTHIHMCIHESVLNSFIRLLKHSKPVCGPLGKRG